MQFFMPLIRKNGTIFVNFAENACACQKKIVTLRRFLYAPLRTRTCRKQKDIVNYS